MGILVIKSFLSLSEIQIELTPYILFGNPIHNHWHLICKAGDPGSKQLNSRDMEFLQTRSENDGSGVFSPCPTRCLLLHK